MYKPNPDPLDRVDPDTGETRHERVKRLGPEMDLAEVIRAHVFGRNGNNTCTCGEEHYYFEHDRHVARVLLASPWLLSQRDVAGVAALVDFADRWENLKDTAPAGYGGDTASPASFARSIAEHKIEQDHQNRKEQRDAKSARALAAHLAEFPEDESDLT